MRRRRGVRRYDGRHLAWGHLTHCCWRISGLLDVPYYQTWKLHAGMDIAAASGTEVHRRRCGRAVQADWHAGCGKYICLSHGEPAIER